MDTTLKYLATTTMSTLLAIRASAPSAKRVRDSCPLDAITDHKASPIFGVTIPAAYREWESIAVAQWHLHYNGELYGNARFRRSKSS